MGEHTAVYGKPAILAAIDKRAVVTLEPWSGSEITITSKNFNKTIRLTYKEVLAIRDDAQAQWERYRETNDLNVLRGIVRNDVMYPVVAIGETLRYFKKEPKTGFHLTIDSEIPLGSGHGSSAAVAVTIAGAVATFLGEPIDNDIIRKVAIRIEQKKHGNPSYGDVGAVVNGGLIWFQKETPQIITVKPLDFSVPEKISQNLLVIQSGVPEESTGEMVHSVAQFKKLHPERFNQILEDQDRLTRELVDVLKNAEATSLIRIIKEGEKNLEKIGVVSDQAKTLIRKIETAGGVAKICGAGGKANGSGIILAYHKNKKEVEKLSKANDLAYYTVQLGGEGLQIE